MSTTTEHVVADGSPPVETLSSPETLPATSGAASAESEALVAAPPHRWSNGLDWPAVFWIVLIHAGMLAAPLFFTWKGLLVAVALGWIVGGLGICVGYHRLLAHGAFQTYRPVRRLLALLGTLAGEGTPVTWVSTHRMHHLHADKPGDPHSPRQGAWWSHVFWLFPQPRRPQWKAMIERCGSDLQQDWFMRLLEKTFIWWHLALGSALLAVGWLGWDLYTGLSFVVFGMFVRLVYVLHVTWAVNSAAHIWGYRNYETDDDSRNLWWVGLMSYGEGWHNNHHAFPSRARHGQRWWEFDMTYAVILLLEKCGLAWHVIRERPTRRSVAEKRP